MGTNLSRHPASISTSVGEPLTSLGLSVCIVTFNACRLLQECLHSVYANTRQLDLEIIVVDNGSQDGVAEMLRREFPQVKFLALAGNTGFTRPSNLAMQSARGRHLLLLNPDTLVLEGALDRLVAFLEAHPEVGICSPKVLNLDGTLQQACRRGESRPWAVISYFLGLSRLFPRRRLFGEYLLTYMDENTAHPAAGVSGSCMLIRREVVEQIGYLDETFFAYQEDADFCFRARQAGWQVYYFPEAQIIHYGGQGGSRVQPLRSIIEWHRSYFRFYRKNYARDYFFLFNWLYYFAMFIKLSLSLLVNLFRREKYAGPRRAN
jgi:GT2 family glycosyltransferase